MGRKEYMLAVKVLPKGQITLPKKMREKINLRDGDVLLVEEKDGVLSMRKGKTVLYLIGSIPATGAPVDEAIEEAIHKAVKERV